MTRKNQRVYSNKFRVLSCTLVALVALICGGVEGAWAGCQVRKNATDDRLNPKCADRSSEADCNGNGGQEVCEWVDDGGGSSWFCNERADFEVCCNMRPDGRRNVGSPKPSNDCFWKNQDSANCKKCGGPIQCPSYSLTCFEVTSGSGDSQGGVKGGGQPPSGGNNNGSDGGQGGGNPGGSNPPGASLPGQGGNNGNNKRCCVKKYTPILPLQGKWGRPGLCKQIVGPDPSDESCHECKSCSGVCTVLYSTPDGKEPLCLETNGSSGQGGGGGGVRTKSLPSDFSTAVLNEIRSLPCDTDKDCQKRQKCMLTYYGRCSEDSKEFCIGDKDCAKGQTCIGDERVCMGRTVAKLYSENADNCAKAKANCPGAR
jgi:hypothetical protein